MSNCVYSEDAYNWRPDVYRQEVRRAMKEYTCGECGETVERGDLYESFTGLYEGMWDTFRTCARCVNIRDDYFDGGWIFGSVANDFREAFGFDYREGIPEGFAPCAGARNETGG